MAEQSDLKPRSYNPENVPLPPPTYNQVCITPLIPGVVSLITLAGLTGIPACPILSSSSPSTSSSTQITHANPPPINIQARHAYSKIKTCLASAGATPRDIVQVRHYIVKNTGDKEVDAIDVVERGWGEEWCAFMDREGEGHRPPDTVVGVAGLAIKGLGYECEVWAVLRH